AHTLPRTESASGAALRFECRPVRAWFQPTCSPCTSSEADRAKKLRRIALKRRPVSKFLEVTEAKARFSFRERGDCRESEGVDRIALRRYFRSEVRPGFRRRLPRFVSGDPDLEREAGRAANRPHQ